VDARIETTNTPDRRKPGYNNQIPELKKEGIQRIKANPLTQPFIFSQLPKM
jgi:hypothetical protein